MKSVPRVAGGGLILSMVLGVPAWASWSNVSIEEICADPETRLVVVGTLVDLKPITLGNGNGVVDAVEAEIKVKEVLFGQPPRGTLRMGWSCARYEACGLDHAEHEGQERIWCLTMSKTGYWAVDHPEATEGPQRAAWNKAGFCTADYPGRVLDLVKRPQVEAALQKRLLPDREVLQKASEICFVDERGGPSVQRPACQRLASAGPAAIPLARDLLGDSNPAVRGLGCRLAGMMKEQALLENLEKLLVDIDTFFKDAGSGCMSPVKTTVGEEALAALKSISGQNFRTAEEAKAWAAAQEAKLKPPPASP